jgi:hypothetical protein
MADNFLNSGASRSFLLDALMDKQNRRYSQEQDPLSIGEAFARTGTRLVDAYSQRKLVDDELKRRKIGDAATREAYNIISGGSYNDPRLTGDLTTTPGEVVDGVQMGDVTERILAPERRNEPFSNEAYNAGINVDNLPSDIATALMGQQITSQQNAYTRGQPKTFAPTTIVEMVDGVPVERRVMPTRNLDGTVELADIGFTGGLTPKQEADLEIETQKTIDYNKNQAAISLLAEQDQYNRDETWLNTGLQAAQEMPELSKMLDLNNKINTGGYESMKTKVSDFLGSTPADVGEFRFLASKRILAALSVFTGAKSDDERLFLETTMPGVIQTGVVNERMLNQLVGIANRQINLGIGVLNRRITRADKLENTASSDYLKQLLKMFKSPQEDVSSQMPGTITSLDDKLTMLGWKLRNNVITEEEYENQKARLRGN